MSGDVGFEEAAGELFPGGRLVGTERLTGGVSADVFRLDVATASGDTRRVVFRQHNSPGFKGPQGQAAALEHGVLEVLHAAGFAVPEPLLLRAGRDGAPGYLVMEWVDGTTSVADGELEAALEQMAQVLAEIHSFEAQWQGVPGLDQIEDPVAAAVAYLPRDRTGDEVAAALDSLAPGWEPNPSVLVHGDYWPGNVIWQSGRLAAVIDWEDACLGDPFADVAAARAELACAYGTDAMQLFTDVYLATRAAAAGGPVGLETLPVWEVYASASALSTMHEWGLDPDAEALRRQHTRSFFERAARDLTRVAAGR